MTGMSDLIRQASAVSQDGQVFTVSHTGMCMFLTFNPPLAICHEVFKVVHVISVKIKITIVVPSSRHKCFQTMTHVYPASKLSGKDQSVLCCLILHQICDERHRSGNRKFVMSQMGLIPSQACSSYNKESLLEEGSKLNVFTFCLKRVELQWVDS